MQLARFSPAIHPSGRHWVFGVHRASVPKRLPGALGALETPSGGDFVHGTSGCNRSHLDCQFHQKFRSHAQLLHTRPKLLSLLRMSQQLNQSSVIAVHVGRPSQLSSLPQSIHSAWTAGSIATIPHDFTRSGFKVLCWLHKYTLQVQCVRYQAAVSVSAAC